MIIKNRIEYNTIEWKWQENRSDKGGTALEMIEKKLEREKREEEYEKNKGNEENEINYGIHS